MQRCRCVSFVVLFVLFGNAEWGSSVPACDEAAELLFFTQEWATATSAKDLAKLEALMSPDYAQYHWDGSLWETRSQWLENLMRRLTIRHSELRNIAVKIHGEMAVVTSVRYWSGSVHGKAFRERDLVVDTWRKRGGRWQVCSRTTWPEPIGETVK
jgi:ketosteroid isomerase-like protein